MDFQFRPIDQWPGTRSRLPKSSPFKASYTDTESLLRRELRMLGAKQVVIQLDLPESKIRRDGMPYADARPVSAGVILSFESPKGSLSFPCDRFDRWQDNLRAVALALEALRKVDRYGVTRQNEQYRGWAKLGGPADAIGFASAGEAANYIGRFIDWLPSMVLMDVHSAFRQAARKVHPDVEGGSAEEFKRLVMARDLILKGGC